MGVTGLWKLIEAAGHEITLESLEGKVFAVDASILMNQAIKGMKEQPNAHLYVLFLRVCKLLTYKIKPVFVFDGSAPILKRQTIAARLKRREEAASQADDIATKLKRRTLQAHAIKQVAGKKSNIRPIAAPAEQDLFALPPVPELSTTDSSHDDGYYELPIHQMLYTGDIDLDQVDMSSEGFRSLPPEYQHEILEELKDHNKHNQGKISLPKSASSTDFSSFQISKLLKTNKISNQIEVLRKEMIGRMTDCANDGSGEVLHANRLLSEDTTHYLLIKRQLGDVRANDSQRLPAVPSGSASLNADRGIESQPSSHLVAKYSSRAADGGCTSAPTVAEKYVTEESSRLIVGGDDSARNSRSQAGEEVQINVKVNNERLSSCVDPVVNSATTSAINRSAPVPNLDGVLSGSHSGASVVEVNEHGLSRELVADVIELPSTKSSHEAVADIGQDKITPTSVNDTGDIVIDTASLSRAKAASVYADAVDTGCDSHKDGGHTGASLSATPEPQSNKEPVGQKPRNLETVELKTAAPEPVAEQLIREHPESIHQSSALSGPLKVTISTGHKDTTAVDLFPPEMFTSYEQQTSVGATGNAAITHASTSSLSNGNDDMELLFDTPDVTDLSKRVYASQDSLRSAFQRQAAMSQAVTQPMIDDAIELLRMFGIPYVLSPSEAEAQCAKLEQLGLCDGTITDDSDIWLFGGSYVLKNFFQHDRFVAAFHKRDIDRLYGLDQPKLIAMALVCGSDYTDGIPGAGPVTALEIISEFDSQDGVSALTKFREWLDVLRSNKGNLPASSNNSSVHTKLRKFSNSLPDNFPNHVVVDAYLKPSVDDSNEPFDWTKPDLDLLRDFGKRKLNWPTSKVDDLVCPVLKKLNSNETQSKLGAFFDIHSTSINTSTEFHSKRLKNAISKLTDKTESDTQPVATKTSASVSTSARLAKIGGKKLSKTGPKAVAKTVAPKAAANGRKRTKASVIGSSAQPIKQIRKEINLSESSDSD